MTTPTLFEFLGGTLTNATTAFLDPATAKMASMIGGITLSGVALYFAIMGYAIVYGTVEESFKKLIIQCLKVTILGALALNIANYQHMVVESFNGLESGLSSIVNTSSATPDQSIYKTLDDSLGKGFDLVGKCLNKASEAGDHLSLGSSISWFFAAMFIGLGALIFTAIGGTVIMVAKLSLALMFAVGPLFIVSLMFPVTARFFDSWFTQVMNYILVVVIASAVMGLGLAGFNAFIAHADVSGSGTNSPMYAALQVLGLTGILSFIAYQAPSMASGLSGGLSMAVLTLRQAAAPLVGARNLADPMTTRRDLESGMAVTARRSNHLVAGNTIINPAYRQHVLENLGKNWGPAEGGRVKK